MGNALHDFPDRIDVALHEMTAKAIFKANGPFKIDWITCRERPEVRAVEGFITDVCIPPTGSSIECNNRETAAIHRGGIADRSSIENLRTVDAQARTVTWMQRFRVLQQFR